MSSAPADPAVTVGVAIDVPEPFAETLTQWRLKVGDAAARKMWPHITLLPPTQLPADKLAEAIAHLEAAAATVRPFEVHLSGTGTFRPVSPVVFVQVARGLAECELLEGVVRCGPLTRDLDFPYHPHVTVAQDVPDAALEEVYDGLAGFTARFDVGSFELFTRDRNGQWSTEREFALAGERS